MEKKIVEVISVQRVTNVATGDIVLQVGFGTPVKVDQKILDRLPLPDTAPRPTEVYDNLIQMMLPASSSGKYSVGSRWNISLKEDGSIGIEKAKK